MTNKQFAAYQKRFAAFKQAQREYQEVSDRLAACKPSQVAAWTQYHAQAFQNVKRAALALKGN